MYQDSILNLMDDLYRRVAPLFENLGISEEYNLLLLTHSLRDVLHSPNGVDRLKEDMYPYDGSYSVDSVIMNSFAPLVAYTISIAQLNSLTLGHSIDLGWGTGHESLDDTAVLYYHFLYAYRRNLFVPIVGKE